MRHVIMAIIYMAVGIIGLAGALSFDSNAGWFFLGLGVAGVVIHFIEGVFGPAGKYWNQPGQPNYQLTAENRIPVFSERPKPPRAPNPTPPRPCPPPPPPAKRECPPLPQCGRYIGQ